MRKTILKYEDDPLDTELSGEQDEELIILQQLVTAIEEKGKDDLAAIVAESGEDVGDEVIRAWQKDVSSRHEFFKDQLKNRMFLSFCLSLPLSLISLSPPLPPSYLCSQSLLIQYNLHNNIIHSFNYAHIYQVLHLLETDGV